jgi:hypothetical protein
MNTKAFSGMLRIIIVLALAFGIAARAQAPSPTHFSGIINDYTAATGVGGPWEMHGTWSLHLKKDSKADFSAVMTMEHPDSWIALNPGTPPTPNVDNPGARSPHTHHFTMTDADVSTDTSVCPTDSPATTGRFVVTGGVSITGNGNQAPFEMKGPSTLQVCVTGGAEVEYSNMTLAFTSTSPATGHFGTHAIHGVVRFLRKSDEPHDDHHEDKH